MVDTPKLQLKIIKMDRFLLEKLTGFPTDYGTQDLLPESQFPIQTTDESREWDTIATNMEFEVKWQWGRQAGISPSNSIFILQILCIHAY
jgi:hypothetical protein